MSEQYVVTNPDAPVPASIYQDVVILSADGQPLRDEQNRIKLRRHVTYGYESLPLSGGTMKGSLYLKGDPTGDKEAVSKEYLEDYVGIKLSEHFPTGAIFPYAAPVVPDGGLWCNSSLVDRTEQSNLFGAIGETWGEGDGSTTFPLPESRDRTLWGASSTSDVGTYTEDGLPNGSGSFWDLLTAGSFNSMGHFNGCFISANMQDSAINYTSNAPSSGFGDGISFDLSKSSFIYGKSLKVQTRGIQALMIIKA